MKVQFDSTPRTDKNRQCITCGIFYCRDSAEIKVCGSLQTSSRVDSDVLRNRQLTIPPSVGGNFKQPNYHKLHLEIKRIKN